MRARYWRPNILHQTKWPNGRVLALPERARFSLFAKHLVHIVNYNCFWNTRWFTRWCYMPARRMEATREIMKKMIIMEIFLCSMKFIVDLQNFFQLKLKHFDLKLLFLPDCGELGSMMMRCYAQRVYYIINIRCWLL
jgi:hypothetical protein